MTVVNKQINAKRHQGRRALILFIQTLALHKSFTYLLTYLQSLH